MAEIKNFNCDVCGIVFTRKANRDRHKLNMHEHETLVYQCNICDRAYDSIQKLRNHRRNHSFDGDFLLLKKAFKENCVVYRKLFDQDVNSVELSHQLNKNQIDELLSLELNQKKSLKVSLIYHVEFVRETEDGKDTNYEMCIREPSTEIFRVQEIATLQKSAKQYTENRVSEFCRNGSGWRLQQILGTDVEIGVCSPLGGSCHLLKIKFLKNVKKIPLKKFQRVSSLKEENCFLQAVAYHFVRSESIWKLSKFLNKKVIFNRNQKVMRIKDIQKFEEENFHLDFKINVLQEEDQDVYPLYVSQRKSAKNVINLLLYRTMIKDEIVEHFTYIENLDSLLRKKYFYKNEGEEKNSTSSKKRSFCPNCLQGFSTTQILARHVEDCSKKSPQKMVLPKEGSKMSFKNYKNKFDVPIIGFFDFESVQKVQKDFQPPSKETKTKVEFEQLPYSYSLILVDAREKVIHSSSYTGKNCVKVFIDELLSLEEKLQRHLRKFVPLYMSIADEKKHRKAKICYICEESLYDDKGKKDSCRDHDHFTSGLYKNLSSVNLIFHSQATLGRVSTLIGNLRVLTYSISIALVRLYFDNFLGCTVFELKEL